MGNDLVCTLEARSPEPQILESVHWVAFEVSFISGIELADTTGDDKDGSA